MMNESAPDDEIQVWHAQEADARRALHDVLAVVRPDYTMVYEAAGWAPHGVVDACLAAARFGGDPGPALSCREVACDVPLDLIRGFRVGAQRHADVVRAIERAFAGRLGGYFGVVAAQMAFHRVANVFDYAWAAAGGPPIFVGHGASPTGGTPAPDGRPGSILDAARRDRRVALAFTEEEADEGAPADPDHPYAHGWIGEPF